MVTQWVLVGIYSIYLLVGGGLRYGIYLEGSMGFGGYY